MNKKTIKALMSLILAIAGILGTIYVTQAPSEKIYGTQVIKVVDGDTIDVSINGEAEKLRLIGINTPETVDPRRPVECFGKEASARAKEILTNKQVTLEYDPTQDKVDKYGRTLAYVILADGTNFNKKMIEDGYAYEYTYEKPYKYQTEFKAAQKRAEDNKRGLWGAGICS